MLLSGLQRYLELQQVCVSILQHDIENFLCGYVRSILVDILDTMLHLQRFDFRN